MEQILVPSNPHKVVMVGGGGINIHLWNQYLEYLFFGRMNLRSRREQIFRDNSTSALYNVIGQTFNYTIEMCM